jgi:hypothetical protein
VLVFSISQIKHSRILNEGNALTITGLFSPPETNSSRILKRGGGGAVGRSPKEKPMPDIQYVI